MPCANMREQGSYSEPAAAAVAAKNAHNKPHNKCFLVTDIDGAGPVKYAITQINLEGLGTDQ